jgi:uncharacterized RDD family membrane protein YckC
MTDGSDRKQKPLEDNPEAAPVGDPEMPVTVLFAGAAAAPPLTALDQIASDDILAEGTLLKHFRIMRLLGRGGMGDVYEAHDESLERIVAIKVIRTAGSISPGDHARLIHEARAQARLNHPHVVQIYYVGLEPDCPFLAMEIVRGTTLAEKIAEKSLSMRDIVRISLQIVDALRRAAQMEIVHADIKPGNILLDEAGTAKLSDFGLAQRNLGGMQSTAGLTGTPRYMAPELLVGGRNSVASDMYALGITLYELTLGRYPYSQTATTLQEQFDLHRAADAEFPQPWPEEVPGGWRQVLARLLAKQPANRYADYNELHSEIRRLQPTARLPAAIVPRAQAWFIDFVCLSIVLAATGLAEPLLHRVGVGSENSIAAHVAHFTTSLLQVAVFGLLVLVYGRFKTTPGKKLFQISVADQHGLPAPPLRLMLRLPLAQFPMSLILVVGFFEEVGAMAFVWLAAASGILCIVWLIVNFASVMMAKERLAVHDRLLGTRAVVDHAG